MEWLPVILSPILLRHVLQTRGQWFCKSLKSEPCASRALGPLGPV